MQVDLHRNGHLKWQQDQKQDTLTHTRAHSDGAYCVWQASPCSLAGDFNVTFTMCEGCPHPPSGIERQNLQHASARWFCAQASHQVGHTRGWTKCRWSEVNFPGPTLSLRRLWRATRLVNTEPGMSLPSCRDGIAETSLPRSPGESTRENSCCPHCWCETTYEAKPE